jgi:RHS repeat-associated protein
VSGSGAPTWLFHYEGKQWDATLGLYDFGARLYDPAVLRFVTPDSARQLASPYVFASNNPLNMVDPSGNLSLWAQVGIGAAMTTVAIIGVVLSVMSLGAFAPAMAAAESGLAGATVGGEAAATAGIVGGEGAAMAGAAAGEAVVESTAVAGAGEVVAGVDAAVAAAAPLTTAQTVGQNMAYVMWTAMTGGWFSGAGTGGLMYDVEHGRDFTAGGFFEAMGVGAITGLAGGGIGGLASMPAAVGLTQGMGLVANVMTRVLMRAALGMIGTDVATLLTDACTGKKVTVQQMLLSSAQGFGAGALSGAFSGLTAVGNLPAAAAITAHETRLFNVATAFKTALEAIKQKASSNDAIRGYAMGGVLLTAGYSMWARHELGKSS